MCIRDRFINNMIAQTSYRACLMALQKFWLDHQEYDYVYNWEMDVRYIGNYLDFFEGIEAYARREPLAPGMLKYDTWYMPGVPASEQIWMSDDARDTTKVGEEADLITLGRNHALDERCAKMRRLKVKKTEG